MFVTTYRRPQPLYSSPRLPSTHRFLYASQSAGIKQILGKHRIQTKLKIGPANDQFEQEADRVADRVVSGVNNSEAIHAISGVDTTQRMCDDCEEELQRKANSGGAAHQVNHADTSALPQFNSGKALPADQRQFFESRIGHAFNDVRIHTDEQAAHSAQSMNARAYTLGRDIVFNTGEYRPGTIDGDRLLAHELTHVVQQRKHPDTIQRWSFGSGTPPHSDYSVVPKDERARVTAAMNIIEKVKNRPKEWPGCHKYYQDNCVGGTSDTFKKKVVNASIWLDKDNSVWGSGVDTDHIAYSAETWRWGRWSIAGVMIHEMMHRCGQDNETINDKAITACGFPDIDKEKTVVKK